MPTPPPKTPNPQALFELAVTHYRAGKLNDAAATVDRLGKMVPAESSVWNLAGAVAKARGKFAEAETHWKKAIRLAASNIDSRFNLALLYQETGRATEAIALYRDVLALNPNHLQTLNNLGGALELQGRLSEALACVDQILALTPQHPNAHKNRGLVLYKLGSFAEATAEIEQALALEPENLSYYFSLSTVKQFTPGDPYLVKLEAMARDADKLSPKDQIHLHFALSKAYGDIGESQKSFRQLIQGNTAKRRQVRYDEAAELGVMSRMQTAFPAGRFDEVRQGAESDLPIFIVGMPRSGTTLVEQILASHPHVHGAGELENFKDLLMAQCQAHSLPFEPESFLRLPPGSLRELGERYVESLQPLPKQVVHLTDKNPTNFLYVGLIHLALPRARIIHTQRDAIDTCLSCFEQKFRGPLSFTYDLAELGRYWLSYDALMSHWRTVLPKGVMLDVRYEDLVAKQEEQTRRLLQYCGLAWDERCLSFHETKRAVGTASAMQVRRPMYTSSIGRWKAYGEDLRPLLDTLQTDAT